jgi:hypothetical protein
MWKNKMKFFLGLWIVVIALLIGCSAPPQAPTAQLPTPQPPTAAPNRESLIPPGQEKITPETDLYPVQSETDEYTDPVPLPYPVNTAGAEDSAFIMPDGNSLYVWFTPDASKAPEQQITDGVTGIYVFHKVNGVWSAPERVMLQDPGKLALDGCEFIQNDLMLFCSIREGYTGIHWFSAQLKDGQWGNWQLADFNPDYEVGELHITADGSELYFHSAHPGGLGGFDIWVSENVNGAWQTPENVTAVNSPYTDGWPFVSPDGLELWFTRGNGAPSLWRSQKVNGEWDAPQQMFSHFSGEASMDAAGNIYFTHHFYKDDIQLEADIYMASKVSP